MTGPGVDPEKVRAVEGYLRGKFPACTVTHHGEPDWGDIVFQIEGKEFSRYVTVWREIFDDYRVSEIENIFERYRLANYLRQVGDDTIIDVTSSGLRPRKR